jgi:hypothetical protein
LFGCRPEIKCLNFVACGRDYAVQNATGNEQHSVAEDGFAGITVQVLCDRPHASTIKAAALVGIGRSNVIDMGSPDGRGIDLNLLEVKLSGYAASFEKERKAAFVALSFGEINTVSHKPNALMHLIFSLLGRVQPKCCRCARAVQ